MPMQLPSQEIIQQIIESKDLIRIEKLVSDINLVKDKLAEQQKVEINQGILSAIIASKLYLESTHSQAVDNTDKLEKLEELEITFNEGYHAQVQTIEQYITGLENVLIDLQNISSYVSKESEKIQKLAGFEKNKFELSARKKTVSVSIETVEDELNDIEEKHSSQSDYLEHLENIITDKREKQEYSESFLEKSTQAKQDLEFSLKTAKQNLLDADVFKSKDLYQQQVVRLEAKNESYACEIQELKCKISNRHSKLEKLQTEISDVKSELTKLAEAKDKAEEFYEACQREDKQLAKKIAINNKHILTSQKELKVLSENLSEHTEYLSEDYLTALDMAASLSEKIAEYLKVSAECMAYTYANSPSIAERLYSLLPAWNSATVSKPQIQAEESDVEELSLKSVKI